MKINFEVLSGQTIGLEVNEQDQVSIVQKNLAVRLKEKMNEDINFEDIKLYSGNTKLISTDIFLQMISKDTKIFVRVSKKPAKDRVDSKKREISTLPIFKEMQRSFKDTALTTQPRFDFKALQEKKSTLLTSGAIPRDTFALTSSSAATINTDNGTTIIDLCSMTLNCILGLNDPWVKLKQISFLTSDQVHFVTARMGFPYYYSYPNRLNELLVKSGFEDAVINHRQCNGSDVVELAVHAAFNAMPVGSNRKKIGSFKGSYHGQNLLAAIVSEHQPARFPFETSTQRELFETPAYEYQSAKQLSSSTNQTLAVLREKGDEFFAVIIEPIQTRNAVHECPIEFLRELRQICTEKNICLIFDEIQTGFGWLGTLCASESHGITPDIAVFSKGVTSGHGALSVMVAKKKYRNVDSTFSGKTNAGDVLGLVAADAVLDRLYGIPKNEIPQWLSIDLQEELQTGLIKKVPETTAKLVNFLERIKSEFPSSTGRIKGQALVRGLEITTEGKPDERLCAWLINRAYENGVYLRQAEHVIIFKPTIVISDVELDSALSRLRKTFKEGEDYRESCKVENKNLFVAKGHG